MFRKILVAHALICFPFLLTAQKTVELASPSGKLKTTVSIGNTIQYSVSHGGDLMLADSHIALSFADGTEWGINPRLNKQAKRTVRGVIPSPFYKKSEVAEHYNELKLSFKGNYNLVFRAYDDGIAYRFENTRNKPFVVKNEQAEFNFPADNTAYIPYANATGTFERQFFNSFENTYHVALLSQWKKERLGILPLLVEGANGKKVCITEAGLLNYPGMYLSNTNGSQSLQAVFAPYPKETKQGGHNELQELILSREPYIARFSANAQFPWRVVIVSENDSELADNDLVYKLAAPNRLPDYSWVRPGKVMWDWWNNWNLYGVDFHAGINNDTYTYYIDAAAKLGVEYVILDEGWAVNKKADLMQVVPEIDLPALCRYAKAKNVGLILWAGYYAINRDMEAVCRHYSEMGIKGFKVDFMDRDDQAMVDFYTRMAETAAKYHLLLDFHGAFKPTGLGRTYPNVLNYEGVFGLEQMKWDAETDMVTYDVTLPFIRMIAGPVDYTQGAMRNATKNNYRSVYSEAMSQGTRCHQLAEYIIFDSPLNMMCDSPSNYLREPECAEFIASIPTVWDETKVLGGTVGKNITIARRSGTTWYVGGMTNWSKSDIEIDPVFLGKGNYTAEIFRDGINADRAACDYVKETQPVAVGKAIKIHLAPGGGFVLKIVQQ